jgi:hypothetical protein
MLESDAERIENNYYGEPHEPETLDEDDLEAYNEHAYLDEEDEE